jgi:quercetin dioxygenase-like cupin family protein
MKAFLFACIAMATTGSTAAIAQTDPVHKTTLQTVAFPGAGYHSVLVRTNVDPGGLVARHTHPGLELGYIVSGDAIVSLDGRPPQRLQSGGSFAVPARTPHSVKNVGLGELTIVSTYVVDPAEPIARPAQPAGSP